MKKIHFLTITLLFLTSMFFNANTANCATTLPDIKLPVANTTGGMPIMDALTNRKSNFKFSKERLSDQIISDLLWAADGINRPDGKKTAPSAFNAQVTTIYVAFPEGVYKYNPEKHELEAFSKEDIRPIVGKYPMILLYTANLARQSKYLAAVDCGFIGQNVYLFSAANNLNSLFLYNLNTFALNSKLEFKLGEEVMFAQVVGYPTSDKKKNNE